MATFTDKFLKGLKPAAKPYEERDNGCPGLLIRVGQRGRKVWEVVVARDRQRKRVRLGTYPDVSLAMARRMAVEKKSAPIFHMNTMRLRDLWDLYAGEVGPTRRAFRDVEQAWTGWAEPVIGGVRVEDLTVRHGAELIEHVRKRSSPNRAAKVIVNLRPMLKFAVGRGLLVANPWAGLHLPQGVEARDRVLSRQEWRSLWEWSRANPYPHGPFLAVLMLSGQRLGEVSGMAWAELEGDLWRIPAARHKSKRGHEVPFPPMLAELVGSLPRHDAFLFSTRAGTHLRPGSKLRDRIAAETGVDGWRFHDLRRTAATFMAEGGTPRFMVERVLGHADHGVTAVYDRASYREEKRQALAVLEGTVDHEQG